MKTDIAPPDSLLKTLCAAKSPELAAEMLNHRLAEQDVAWRVAPIGAPCSPAELVALCRQHDCPEIVADLLDAKANAAEAQARIQHIQDRRQLASAARDMIHAGGLNAHGETLSTPPWPAPWKPCALPSPCAWWKASRSSSQVIRADIHRLTQTSIASRTTCAQASAPNVKQERHTCMLPTTR